MFRWGVSVLLILFNFAFALEKTDQEAIENVIADYTHAWNEQGCKGFADGFAQVFVQQGGKWEITASQNTLISK